MNSILGHTEPMQMLKQAHAEGKLHHAYLFAGIDGIGKKMVALRLIQKIMGERAAAEKIEKNIHPDFHRILPDGLKIKIETIRALKSKIFFHPLESTVKTVLIEEAEMMTEAAANALLKILEEPPADTYFFLISSRPFRLLPTIRSRCQRLDFHPLPTALIVEYLKQHNIPESEAPLRVLFAQGSLKAALAFDARLLQEAKEKIDGLQKEKSVKSLLTLAENLSDDEDQLPFFFNNLAHLWHQKIIQSANAAQTEQVLEQWLAIQRAIADLENYANKQLLVENLLFKLAPSA